MAKNLKRMLVIVVVATLVAVASGSGCEACVDGYCHSEKILMQNVDITDQLAVDWTNNILYAQLYSKINTAFYLEDNSISKIHVVQTLNTSGLTVQQATQELYTADYNNNVYKIKQGSNTATIFLQGSLDGVANLLCYANNLYLCKKGKKNLFYYSDTNLTSTRDLVIYTLTDFVKTESGIVFVADDIVYNYRRPYEILPKVLTNKKVVLSTDKHGVIYLGETSQNVIYKKDNVTDELVIYAYFKTGSINKFVFDKDDRIIVYDSIHKNLAIWNRENDACTIHEPHKSYQINVISKEHQESTVSEWHDEFTVRM